MNYAFIIIATARDRGFARTREIAKRGREQLKLPSVGTHTGLQAIEFQIGVSLVVFQTSGTW